MQLLWIKEYTYMYRIKRNRARKIIMWLSCFYENVNNYIQPVSINKFYDSKENMRLSVWEDENMCSILHLRLWVACLSEHSLENLTSRWKDGLVSEHLLSFFSNNKLDITEKYWGLNNEIVSIIIRLKKACTLSKNAIMYSISSTNCNKL